MGVQSLRDLMVMPEVSPYHYPPWGADKLRDTLNECFNFEELRQLARRPGAPTLQIGAVEVLSGLFELFTGEELCAECLLASAAIPELFRAVSVPGRGVFWDGLFSQNPPIHDLACHQIDELWVIQINPSTCARVPTETHQILDRRNSLAGNLSMEQELRFIETNNRAIANGHHQRSRSAAGFASRALRWIGFFSREPSSIAIPSCSKICANTARPSAGGFSRTAARSSTAATRESAPVPMCAERKRSRSAYGMGIRVTGLGAYVPERAVTNAELARTVDTSQEWIVAKTGILERRISAPGEAPSELGYRAAAALPEPRRRRQIRRRSDGRRLRHAGSIAAGGRVHDSGEARNRRISLPGVRRELGVRRLRLCAERGAEHDAVGSRAVSPRPGHRYRRILQDRELERSAHLHLFRRRRGSGPVVAGRRRRAAHPLPAGQRRTGQPAHPGAGERHAHADHRRDSGKATEYLRNGWSKSMGFRRQHRAAGHVVAAGRARPWARGSGSGDPAPEQPAHDRGDHGRARAAHGARRHHRRDLRQYRGSQHPADAEPGARAGRLKPGARDVVRIRRGAFVGARPSSTGERMHNILITGAASGIGAGLAVELARAGDHIVVSDLRLDEANAVAASIRAGGGSAEAVALDVTSDESVAAALASPSCAIDVLVNNAGLQHVAPLEEFPMAKWALLVQVMLIGVARLTRALLPGMRARGFGRVINIGSIHSLVASPFKSAYVAAKHGLIGFSKVMALETADTDITINTICPSYVKTPLVDKQIAEQARARGIPEAEVVGKIMLRPMPKGVFIGYDELAGIAAFLSSPAARNITGQAIVVDGGWTAQ